MIRNFIVAVAGYTLAFAFLCAAFAQDIDCNVIRAKVKEHGKIAAYAWALANGYSPKDIARIRKACGV